MTAPARVVLLVTARGVPAGQLTAPAWDVLRAAARVLVGDDQHPLLPYVGPAGAPTPEVLAPGLAPAQALAAAARDASGPVVWLCEPAEPESALTLEAELRAVAGSPAYGAAGPVDAAGRPADAAARPLDVERVVGSTELPGARLLDLVAVMDRLRSPGGCPWDAQQTHESLVTYLLEETFETVEAIETGDDTDLREELGDLLLQVVFHARIAQERDREPWSVDDVAAGIVAKLVRRHPHVFADAHAPTAEHVEARWDALKAEEKQRGSAVDGVPLAQPALALAAKLLSRTTRAGLDVPPPAVGALPAEAYADEAALGGALLAAVAAARDAGLDPERALRSAARRYAEDVRTVERSG